ncbi:hypothetical protein GV827_22875 [Sulfitobacter sp. JBTF-M27]|uniref:Uncharacterized protein n=2 Tax=Sulfitobacter sediminilitoris TaxID=2698830 RepID=A0A6P0CGD3_9RHOB|nr:hypothetical protein [Sulfitobacter sediminilitoris]NEK25212.1 hypothetical protein [Sulfitobacter sediminilitoris]
MNTKIQDAISFGIEELVDMQLQSGEFIYRTGSGVPTPDNRYNILRHSGAIYSLADCYAFAKKPLNQKIQQGINWVSKDHLRVFLHEDDWMLAVASDDRMAGSFNSFKLGGSALYLSAISLAAEKGLAKFPEDLVRRIGEFLLYMQKDDGGFHSKIYRRSKKINTKFVSLYYPGEAALALTFLGEQNPKGPWFRAAVNSLMYLARLRKGRRNVELDHWALIATAKILDSKFDISQFERETILNHMEQIVQSIINEADNLSQDGCCTGDGRTCPTATRLEGLTSVYELLLSLQKNPLVDRVRELIEEYTLFLLDAQYSGGYRKGGFSRSSVKWLRDNKVAPDRRSDEVRIDYIQHAICGLRGALEII